QTQVEDEMVGEEVDVDDGGDDRRQPPRRIMREAEVEEAMDADEVGADGGVGESREQGHGTDVEPAAGSVVPRTVRGLEDLHARAHDMEDDDDDELTAGLESGGEHADLDEDGEDDEQIVARQPGVVRMEAGSKDDGSEHEGAEQARPRLLDPEGEELLHAGGNPGEDADGDAVEHGFQTGEFAAIGHVLLRLAGVLTSTLACASRMPTAGGRCTHPVSDLDSKHAYPPLRRLRPCRNGAGAAAGPRPPHHRDRAQTARTQY